KMNQVTPKAGTLKQKSWNLLQNVSTKLIASVLMLAVIALTPVSLMAEMKHGDSCCKTSKTVDFPKGVYLTMPSSEMVKRADSEMNRNLYRSLRESKISKLAKWFAAADEEMNGKFKGETTISGIIALNADETANIFFAAENLSITLSDDENIHALFIAEHVGIQSSWGTGISDDQMNTAFSAENITMPGNETFSAADLEIHQTMMSEQAGEIAVNSAK
ncbi:MAG TPA: hypothetical protein VLA58_00095, partial [Chitinophagaceae bacterium]|nr:hypothetical protein [Chitinophagaceae bacterium]